MRDEVWKMMVEGGGTREVSYWFRTGSGSMENISDPDPPHCFAAGLQMVAQCTYHTYLV